MIVMIKKVFYSRWTLAVSRWLLLVMVVLLVCRMIFFKDIPYINIVTIDILERIKWGDVPAIEIMEILGIAILLLPPCILLRDKSTPPDQQMTLQHKFYTSLFGTVLWFVALVLTFVFGSTLGLVAIGLVFVIIVMIAILYGLFLLLKLILKNTEPIIKFIKKISIRYLKGEVL